MIFLGHKEQQISGTRQAAIQKCFDDGLVTDDNGVRLLKSFITGQASLVPQPLLELMNTVEEGKVHWILCHMMVMLKEFASHGSLPNHLVLVLENIVSQFDRFVLPSANRVMLGRHCLLWCCSSVRLLSNLTALFFRYSI